MHSSIVQVFWAGVVQRGKFNIFVMPRHWHCPWKFVWYFSKKVSSGISNDDRISIYILLMTEAKQSFSLLMTFIIKKARITFNFVVALLCRSHHSIFHGSDRLFLNETSWKQRTNFTVDDENWFFALHYSPPAAKPNVHWELDSFWHWMNDLIHFLCWTQSESTCVMIPHAVSDEFFFLVDSIHQVFIRLKKLQSRENELFLYI